MTWSRGHAQLHGTARAVDGLVRVAAPSDTSLQLLCAWTDEYTLRHPGARVMVFVGDRMHDFNRDAVDIAIRYGELKDSSMVGRLLTSCERIVVAAPAYLQRAGVREPRPIYCSTGAWPGCGATSPRCSGASACPTGAPKASS